MRCYDVGCHLFPNNQNLEGLLDLTFKSEWNITDIIIIIDDRFIAPDKFGFSNNIFFLFLHINMLLVLIRSALASRF